MNQPRVRALGFFDGVHLGHGQLLTRCRQEADRLGCRAAALTFDSHPDSLVSGKAVPLLSAPQDRGPADGGALRNPGGPSHSL